jgi:hypothetical protein
MRWLQKAVAKALYFQRCAARQVPLGLGLRREEPDLGARGRVRAEAAGLADDPGTRSSSLKISGLMQRHLTVDVCVQNVPPKNRSGPLCLICALPRQSSLVDVTSMLMSR